MLDWLFPQLIVIVIVCAYFSIRLISVCSQCEFFCMDMQFQFELCGWSNKTPFFTDNVSNGCSKFSHFYYFSLRLYSCTVHVRLTFHFLWIQLVYLSFCLCASFVSVIYNFFQTDLSICHWCVWLFFRRVPIGGKWGLTNFKFQNN